MNGKNPLMVETRKKEGLDSRLRMHFLLEFIDNNGVSPDAFHVGQLYAEDKTHEMMKILNQWRDDGSPQ